MASKVEEENKLETNCWAQSSSANDVIYLNNLTQVHLAEVEVWFVSSDCDEEKCNHYKSLKGN